MAESEPTENVFIDITELGYLFGPGWVDVLVALGGVAGRGVRFQFAGGTVAGGGCLPRL